MKFPVCIYSVFFLELVTLFTMRLHYIVAMLFIQAGINFEILKCYSRAAVVRPHPEEEDFYDFDDPGNCQQLFGLFMCESEGDNRSDQLLDDYFSNSGQRVYVLNNNLRKIRMKRRNKQSNIQSYSKKALLNF